MESTAAALIADLHSPSAPTRHAAARAVKNAVVGNPTNKRLFLRLGALPPLLSAAAAFPSDAALSVHALAALGSLAPSLSPAHLPTLLPPLLAPLFSPHPPLVLAAVRALKLLVLSHPHHPAPPPAVAVPSIAPRLVALLAAPDDALAAAVAVLIAGTVALPLHAHVYDRAAAVPALVRLFCRTAHPDVLDAALNALSALARQDPRIVHVLVARHNIITLVLPLTRCPSDALRLAACRLLTIFHSAGRLVPGLDGTVTTALVGLVDRHDLHSRVSTSHTLAELLLGSEDLQRIATETHVIEKLAPGIKCPTPDEDDDNDDDNDDDHTPSRPDAPMSMQPITNGSSSCESTPAPAPAPAPHTRRKQHATALRAAALTALAAVCSEFDEAREIAVRLQLVPHVIGSLSGSYPDVVLGSLKCIRSLSRSVKIVRRDIANEHIGRILLNLLSSESGEVARIASATLCNLVLEFSPVREVVLKEGGTKALVGLLRSEDEELRKNALWALKNLFFKADLETKTAVMDALGYENLQRLCTDTHPRVREIALTIVRNLACSGSAESQCKQLDTLLAATDNRLIPLLAEALTIDAENSEIAVQALYVVCNIASGTETHKALLMNSDIPELLLWWSSHENERARIAAIWCTINLSWKHAAGRRSSRLLRNFQVPNRNPRRRIEMLRRQHLPLPSSLEGRLALESAERNELNASPSEGRNADVSMAAGGGGARFSADESDGGAGDSVMSASDEEQVQRMSGYEWRIGRLRELGFESRLRALINDPHIEVQGRARAALELFDCHDGNPLDYDPEALLD